jgi:hypothetical protein
MATTVLDHAITFFVRQQPWQFATVQDVPGFEELLAAVEAERVGVMDQFEDALINEVLRISDGYPSAGVIRMMVATVRAIGSEIAWQDRLPPRQNKDASAPWRGSR